ncbi:MAG: BatA domain-containing protein, partial [Alphaproteobacteria bacterium]
MFSLGAFGGAVGFANPWLLAALIALPVLWWLLRAIPPSPKLEVFAGVRLLLGLEDPERQAAKTPWWLLLLRVLALAAVIVGFAGPVLNPSTRLGPARSGPVLILMDQGWASAPDWSARKAAALAAIDEAVQARRPVILWQAAGGAVPPVLPARAARA